MIEPTFTRTSEHQSEGRLDPSADAAAMRKAVLMPGAGTRAVYWNGHEFETAAVRLHDDGGGWWRVQPVTTEPHEAQMRHYYPIDPRIERVDVDGATRAYPNAAKTGWLFAHADAGTHHDYELTLLAAVDGVMQPLFRQYQVDVFAATSDEARNRAAGRFRVLSEFYGAVAAKARELARAVHLGHRQQAPHPAVGYLDADITAAVAAVEAAWKTARAVDMPVLAVPITYVRNSLTMPTPETRWAKAARLEAEAKAKAKAAAEAEAAGDGDDSANGA